VFGSVVRHAAILFAIDAAETPRVIFKAWLGHLNIRISKLSFLADVETTNPPDVRRPFGVLFMDSAVMRRV
jgi:hypothetical protein